MPWRSRKARRFLRKMQPTSTEVNPRLLHSRLLTLREKLSHCPTMHILRIKLSIVHVTYLWNGEHAPSKHERWIRLSAATLRTTTPCPVKLTISTITITTCLVHHKIGLEIHRQIPVTQLIGVMPTLVAPNISSIVLCKMGSSANPRNNAHVASSATWTQTSIPKTSLTHTMLHNSTHPYYWS